MSISVRGVADVHERRLAREEGFTLVEVLMAITMLSIAVFGATTVLTGSLNRLADVRSRTHANAVINERIEVVRSHRYASIGMDTLSPGDPLYGSLDPETSTVRSNIRFTVSTDVAFKDDDSDGLGALDSDSNTDDYKAVTVTVDWVTTNSRPQQLSVESYFQPTGSSASQNSPPQVTILTPISTTAVTGTAQITAWAYDPEDGNEITVSISLRHSSEATPTVTQIDSVGPTYGWSWNTLASNDSTVPYQVTVSAFDSRGSRNADIVSLYVDNNAPYWTPSADLTGTALSGSEVRLNWNAGGDLAGVSGYNAYRGTYTGGTWVYTMINASVLTTLTANDIGLTNSTTYRYKVRVVDWGGHESVDSNVIEVTTPGSGPDTTPPTVPVITATRTGFYSARVTMNSTDNASANVYYIVQREKYTGAAWVETTQTAVGRLFGPRGTTVTFDDAGATALQPGLIKNIYYHYRVRACDASGNWSDWSAWVQVNKN